MISNDDSPLPDTDVQYLRSEQVGDEFKILVGHSGASGSTPAHALFMGDAWANFGTAVETIRLLNDAGDLPHLLVVAVGYRVAKMEDNYPLRSRDFTPNVDPTSGEPGTANMGGASRFLAFLRDDLKPWVRERYGVDTDDSTLFGYSLGGLFATYVLLNEPATFRRYGIGSPALDWGKGLMFDREAEYARTHDDLPAKVFFSVGAYENTEGDRRWRAQLPAGRRSQAGASVEGDPPFDAVADTERMVASLRGRRYPSLDIEYEVLPGEYHQTAPPVALSRSLRYLFDAPR